jgi:hypothetical protein
MAAADKSPRNPATQDRRASARHGWRRFSLRTTLVVLTVLCFFLAMAFNRARRQRSAVDAIISTGGMVVYHDELDAGKEPASVRDPIYLELFRHPVHVTLVGQDVDDAFIAKHLRGMRNLESLSVHCPRLTDAALCHNQ